MPTVAARYVELAERIATRLRSPRIRALHLPPAHAATGQDAEFCAVELTDGSFGFSYALLDAAEPQLRAYPDAAAFVGMAAVELARGYAGKDPAAKALGFAAVNALSQHLFARANWLPPDAGDSLGEIEPQRGEHIGMIGLFRPLVARVGAAGARLTVLELKPELAGEHDGFRVTLDPADLAAVRPRRRRDRRPPGVRSDRIPRGLSHRREVGIVRREIRDRAARLSGRGLAAGAGRLNGARGFQPAGNPARIAALADVPMRFAPAASIDCASASVRMPPDALTPNAGPTSVRIRRMSATVAPPPG